MREGLRDVYPFGVDPAGLQAAAERRSHPRPGDVRDPLVLRMAQCGTNRRGMFLLLLALVRAENDRAEQDWK